MFRSLIESLRDVCEEGVKKLMPFSLSVDKVRKANELLKKVRRDAGYPEEPATKTKGKVLLRLGHDQDS
jgi:hypothetical protein